MKKAIIYPKDQSLVKKDSEADQGCLIILPYYPLKYSFEESGLGIKVKYLLYLHI